MKQTRRSFIRTTALGSAAAALASRLKAGEAPTIAPRGLAKRPARPNLLFLWTDQHRGDVVPWAGNSALKAPKFFTPLGEKSFLFHRTYVAQPVCTPSRGTILSGLWPHNHGAIKNNSTYRPGVRTIAEYLPQDYATAYYGKWHLGEETSAQRGFRDWRSIEDEYRRFYKNPEDLKRFSDHYKFLVERGFPPDKIDTDDPTRSAIFSREMAAALPEPYTKLAFLAREAEKFLHERRDGQPFILHVNSLEPHPPTYGPLNELHDPDAMPAGPAFARKPDQRICKSATNQLQNYRTKGYKNHPISNEHDWRRLRANYYGLVSMVDNAYARVMRALEASGQADNTIVVYTSDHGDMCGDHTLMGKGYFYDASAGVPLAIHVPWLSRERIDFRSPISTVDLVPTLLDLMGIDIAGQVDGVSRAGALRDPASWKPENITVEWTDGSKFDENGRSRVAADGWKLNLYQGDGPELFDLKSDPGEIHNRYAEPAQRDRVRRMTAEIHEWQQSTRDSQPLATV
jgi:arylsulfatase A-like enzyme